MQVTDLHIKAGEPERSLAYPGPREITPEEVMLTKALLAQIEKVDREDFMIESGGAFWRGRRDSRAVDGTWYRMRRMADEAPCLNTLPSPLREAIKHTLLSPHMTRGALVIITGGPGCGKTTTGSATVKSRLQRFGGFCYTIEDPPELPLNGHHGPGYCTQTWVAGDRDADWAESMRGALRSQPVGTNLMMYVGEVRDTETAQVMIRAASNGFLVIGTCFGANLQDGVRSFLERCGSEMAGNLAAVLRVVVHQNIIDGHFTSEILVSAGPGSPVAALIRSGQLTQLANEIMYQRNQLGTTSDLLAR